MKVLPVSFLNISKEVLLASECKKAAELHAVKAGGQKKLLIRPVRYQRAHAGRISNSFLLACSSEAL